jgi:sigma-B regulation protein RsbU (phosphoserine phosphatase)
VNEGNIFQFHPKPCPADVLEKAIRTGIEEYRKITADHDQLKKVKVSLAHASEVQQKLMPKCDPKVDGFDIAGKSIWCDETGGDYYDFFDRGELCKEKIGIVVGDVAGHGISSALLMTTARAFLRERVYSQGSPAITVSAVNKRLTADTEELNQFMTMFYSEIDIKGKYIRWVRAGHEPAILYDPKRDTFEDLAGQGLPLGVSEDAVYEESVKSVNPGQIILIGTDGVGETRNAEGEMFGKNRVRKLIRENAKRPAKEIITVVLDAIENFRFPLEKEDDATLVVVKVQ